MCLRQLSYMCHALLLHCRTLSVSLSFSLQVCHHEVIFFCLRASSVAVAQCGQAADVCTQTLSAWVSVAPDLAPTCFASVPTAAASMADHDIGLRIVCALTLMLQCCKPVSCVSVSI